MFLTPEEVVEAVNKGGRVHEYVPDQYFGGLSPQLVYGRIDVTRASKILQSVRKATLERRQWKNNRPWELVDLTSKLNPNKVWVGIEFESGFPTRASYEAVVNHVFDNFNHTVIDREGYGTYAPEITFAPEHLDNLLDGTAKIWQLLNWMDQNKIKMSKFSTTAMVGTHANISTPAFRKLTEDYQQAHIVQLINRSILSMGTVGANECFGRRPYGLGNLMGIGVRRWIEFKLFHSTQDLEAFGKYVGVISKLAAVMEKLSVSTRVVKNDEVIWNLCDILTGRSNRIQYKTVPAEHRNSWENVTRFRQLEEAK